MKTYRLIIASATLAAVVAAASCSDAKKEDKSKAANMNHVMSVDVAYPIRDSLTLSKAFPGTISATGKIDVVARVNGYIIAKYFTDGDYVAKGQTLFKIEDTEYRDALTQAQASLQSAVSKADYTERQYDAMKKALESDAVSEMDVVQAENNKNSAAAALKSARSQLQTAQTNLGYCTVKALSSGHIRAPKFDVGEYVGGEVSPVILTTIYDDSSVNAVISVNDADYIEMMKTRGISPSLFDAVPVSFTQDLSHDYTGKLKYVAPEISSSTGTMTVKVGIDNKHGELRDGMYAVVHMPINDDSDAILIRDAAIGTDQNGKYVYVVNDSNKIVYTPIKVGDIYRDTLRIVTSGLDTSDRYVTKALLKVRNGMPVKPVEVK